MRERKKGGLNPSHPLTSVFTSPLTLLLTECEFFLKPCPSRVSDVQVHNISSSLSHESIDAIVMLALVTSPTAVITVPTADLIRNSKLYDSSNPKITGSKKSMNLSQDGRRIVHGPPHPALSLFPNRIRLWWPWTISPRLHLMVSPPC